MTTVSVGAVNESSQQKILILCISVTVDATFISFAKEE